MNLRRKRNVGDLWGKRRHPYTYTPKVLREMLVDDLLKNRPVGGPMEIGAAFVVGACDHIARHERKRVDDVWQALLDEASAKLGHQVIPVVA